MAAKGPRRDLEQIADRVVERMEDLIAIMQDAADQVSRGISLENVNVGSYQLYLAKKDIEEDESGQAEAVVCAIDFEDYIRILENVAAEQGFCLDEQAELEVTMPEAEFGDDLVTGGFGNFKGVSVQIRNDCLEELMQAVCQHLEARGLMVACIAEDDVIFCLPLRERTRSISRGSEAE
jgi:hypothetical protein